MADILDGATDHANYAPLTHKQTMEVSRYLHDLIRQMQGQIADLGNRASESSEAVTSLKQVSQGSNQHQQQMQDNLGKAYTEIENLRNEQGRTNSNVGKLQAGLAGTNDKVSALIDAQKVTDTTIKRINGDIEEQANNAHNLKETLEKKIERDIKALRDDLARSDLNIQHLQDEAASLKKMVHDNKENLRQLNQRVKDQNDRHNDMETMMKIIEKRVSDNSSGLKSTRMNLEDFNTATLKLHEDHENTKGHVGDVRDSNKKCHAHVKQVHGKLEDVAQQLGNTQVKLQMQSDHGENLKQTVDRAMQNIASSQQDNARANFTLGELSDRLAQVGSTADAVKAGLKESNSLLLPNIHLDSHEARHASARHGSLLMSSHGGGLGSPQKTKKNAR